MKAYGVSKLANILFTRGAGGRRLGSGGQTANMAAHLSDATEALVVRIG